MSDAEEVARSGLGVYRHPRVLAMLFLGFSSGLPFLLVFQTLSAWLTQAHFSLTRLGYYSAVSGIYSLKFFWAPVVDRLRLPGLSAWLGRRRAWMVVSQIAVAAGLVVMGMGDPTISAGHMLLAAMAVAAAGATQDICVDAWRIEAVVSAYQGAMAAAYQFGYRFALIVSGAGALHIAERWGWHTSYLVMAALVGVGLATALLIPEPTGVTGTDVWRRESRVVAFLQGRAHWPTQVRDACAWFIGAVVCPFIDFFERQGLATALLILLFIALYRLADLFMGPMATPFYLSLGFKLSQIANVTKLFGIVMTMLGAAVGGLLVARIGVVRCLIIGALLVAIANLYFAWMATQASDIRLLAVAISLDNIGGGIEGTAFIAYMSALTNVAYTATQYALFSSLAMLLGKMIGVLSGRLVDAVHYPLFFVISASLVLPGLAMLALLHIRRQRLAAQLAPS
jgi:PAT family beta-lactamase induction signal transducer AmpG